MNKHITRGFYAAILCLALTACQSFDHDVTNPNNTESLYKAKTYTEQFQRIWQGIDVGYVFWKWETVDWDEIYDTWLPVFQEADKRVDDGQEGMTLDEYKAAYKAIIQPLKDHHMALIVYRPDDKLRQRIMIQPSDARKDSADYHPKFKRDEHFATLDHMLRNGVIDGHLRADTTFTIDGNDAYMVEGMLSDGGTDSIAYLYISSFMIDLPDGTDSICNEYVGSWLRNIASHQNVSVIFDTRNNGGGLAAWLQALGKHFTKEPFYHCLQYQKSDFSRYELTPGLPEWIQPDTVGTPMQLSSQYPFVCLFDQHSCSNGEEIPWMFSYLPGYASVGEPTCGGMGGLLLDNYTTTQSGAFGDSELLTSGFSAHGNYYCYMSTFATVDARTGESPEGIGMIPDVRCTLDTAAFHSGDSDNQLLAAIKLIKSRH